jgi:hypothetical protein
VPLSPVIKTVALEDATRSIKWRMASAPGLAPIKTLDGLFFAMEIKGYCQKLIQNTNVLQNWLETSKMSENRHTTSPFHNNQLQSPSSFSS